MRQNLPERFRLISAGICDAIGSPVAFLSAFLLIIFWLATGPHFGFSENWQMVINSVTTIITFLMVFLIQNSQNRETKAINLKLDELIRANENANNAFMAHETKADAEIKTLKAELAREG